MMMGSSFCGSGFEVTTSSTTHLLHSSQVGTHWALENYVKNLHTQLNYLLSTQHNKQSHSAKHRKKEQHQFSNESTINMKNILCWATATRWAGCCHSNTKYELLCKFASSAVTAAASSKPIICVLINILLLFKAGKHREKCFISTVQNKAC